MINPKYYIVYPYKMTDEIIVPKGWGSFPHAITVLLKELTGAKYLGSEIKWILDNNHRRSLIEEYNVTDQDIEDYLKSRCHIFSFTNKIHRNKAVKELIKMRAKTFISVDGYRDVLLTQAYYTRNNELPNISTIENNYQLKI